eukprot:3173094-Rhodomonas_salina.1
MHTATAALSRFRAKNEFCRETDGIDTSSVESAEFSFPSKLCRNWSAAPGSTTPRCQDAASCQDAGGMMGTDRETPQLQIAFAWESLCCLPSSAAVLPRQSLHSLSFAWVTRCPWVMSCLHHALAPSALRFLLLLLLPAQGKPAAAAPSLKLRSAPLSFISAATALVRVLVQETNFERQINLGWKSTPLNFYDESSGRISMRSERKLGAMGATLHKNEAIGTSSALTEP